MVDGASEWTPASPFAPGTYEWWVRVSNPSSPNWSAGRRFNLPSTLWWDATPAGDGWKTLDWFGFFIELGGGWIYHYTHGFMYPLGETTSSLWLWTPSLGWLWTGDAVYPWLYRVSPAAWLWYARDTAAPRWFYNAGTAQWEQNP
jgi:hypothetical protein